MLDKQLSILDTDNNLSNEFCQVIQHFNKINIQEIEPTIKNINNYIFEGYFNIVIDELANLIFNNLNKGEGTDIIKRQVLDYINNNQMITLQQIYIWILNNQNNSNSIYLLGYFNYYGIETKPNKQKAIELYQKAAELENILAQLNLASEYTYSKKNYNLAFKLFKKLAEEYAYGMNNLGFCYEKGIGTNYDEEKAFESYQKAADLGNFDAMDNLGWCYYKGIGTDINNEKAFEVYQKAADLGSIKGILNLVWCYNKGIGTEVNKQKVFELYQKAANLENDTAQCELAAMYEKGYVTKKDIDQAIYWYKKSAVQGNQISKNKLENLTVN